ncbi:ATP-binding response regulator [Neorhodopirellula lusitana]|uniref:ATP-binding response regulator n=1 Tax=Neorhodopirellula lusitana TaxID=445327 RepID=UPI00384C1129
MSACVLIFESDPVVLARLVSTLSAGGYRCLAAETQAKALQFLDEEQTDLMVTEVPSMSGRRRSDRSVDAVGAHASELAPHFERDAGSDSGAVDAAPLNRWMEELRGKAPHLPIVLLTRPGAEHVACEALLRSAASYVPESLVETALVDTVGQVIAVGRNAINATDLEQCVSRTKLELVLPSQESLVPSIIAKLERTAEQLGLFDEMIWTQVAMALDEAILNAMIHGNLEVQSSLREVDDGKAYWDLIVSRRESSPYAERRTFVTLTATRSQAVFVIRDEGPGFDLSQIPDPDDPANLESIGGRGLLLINAFMDEVHHNESGNEITMIKRKSAGPLDEN